MATIKQFEFDESYDLAKTIINKSGSFITYLNKSDHRGEKFKYRTEVNNKQQTTNTFQQTTTLL
ncbi:MAG: hypothetical protein ACT4ON_15285 [Bacteroidota bacterium]